MDRDKKTKKKEVSKPKEKPVKLNMTFEEAIDLALKTPAKKKSTGGK